MIGPLEESRRWPTSSPARFRLAVLLAVLLTGLAVGLVFTRLLDSVRDGMARAGTAHAVVDVAFALDRLEWRAIAGEPLPEIRPEFDRTADLLRNVLPGDESADAVQVRQAAAAYAAAVDQELALLEAGERALALELDETVVDPSFELVLERAEAIAERETAAARTTNRLTRTVAWVTVAGGALVVALGVLIGLRHREQREQQRRTETVNRRFRSLVESSADVITVVSDVDRVVVMSPSLGFLGAIARIERPVRMVDLLPPDRLIEWRQYDQLVELGQVVDPFELSVPRHDGSLAVVEAVGRPLAGEPGHRVWVWRDVSQRTALEAELSHRAFHDSLTGLANRALLLDRTTHALSRAERSGEPLAVLLCDLDDFKTINDALGHHHGDELLLMVTARMAGCLRASDTLARLGGDEFAVLLENTDLELATGLAERILGAVGDQLTLAERELFPTLSIGVAAFERGVATDELLRRADVAMYEAKRSGKGRAEVYRPGLVQAGNDPLVLQSELRRAVADGALTLVYQPTVSLVDGSVSSVEALVRWTHPKLGPIPPMTFIPMAEASGTIVALGKWVLAEACRAAMTLTGSDGTGITMHVNVSPHQLNDPTWVTFVKTTLAETGLAPELLVLEVTEGSLLANPASFERLLELHGHGVRLAIDDFGTGYASITYLQRLPIDILKIDRAFVSGDALPPDERRAFLNTIISMAQNLQLTSVAEGVETDEQRLEVASLGCDRGQGYLWARPVDLATLHDTIAGLHPGLPARPEASGGVGR